jgi:hypothetical protein
MRVMDLFSGIGVDLDDVSAASFVWDQIIGYINWPEDPARRRVHIVSCAAQGFDRIDDLQKGQSQEPLVQLLIERYPDSIVPEVFEREKRKWFALFGEFGGLKAVSPLLRGEVPSEREWYRKEGGRAMIAGEVLGIVRAIETRHRQLLGPGSINKAIFLLDRAGVRNEKYAKQDWQKYKNVAHLAASLRLINNHRLEYDREGLSTFLVIARDFQEWGTGFIPHGRKEPLLDPETIWSLPELPEFGPLPRMSGTPPLHADDIATLQKYRS